MFWCQLMLARSATARCPEQEAYNYRVWPDCVATFVCSCGWLWAICESESFDFQHTQSRHFWCFQYFSPCTTIHLMYLWHRPQRRWTQQWVSLACNQCLVASLHLFVEQMADKVLLCLVVHFWVVLAPSKKNLKCVRIVIGPCCWVLNELKKKKSEWYAGGEVKGLIVYEHIF